MNIRSFTAAALSALAVISCAPQYEKPVDASQVGFAISFFKNVNASEPSDANVVVSPYSAAVALSMLAEGAEGKTRAEFDNALGGVIYKAEDLGGNDTVVVKSANSLWIDDNFSPRNRYVNLLEKDFDAFLPFLQKISFYFMKKLHRCDDLCNFLSKKSELSTQVVSILVLWKFLQKNIPLTRDTVHFSNCWFWKWTKSMDILYYSAFFFTCQ